MKKKGKVVVSKDGPYLVSGALPLRKEISEVGEEGEPVRWVGGKEYPAQEYYCLCRCGQSKNKPFCDGTHTEVNFDGAETATRKPYAEQAETLKGPGVHLQDAKPLCARARFCHPKGGVWNLTLESGDPEKKKWAIQEACNCPSGRLVAHDAKTEEPIEPECEPSVNLVEHPHAKISGPIWVKGGVEVESDGGEPYETRNRMTLCRCGESRNKPFCDGSHEKIGFADGDDSLNRGKEDRASTTSE